MLGTEDSDAITINATPTDVTVTSSGGSTICENATLSASGGSGGTIYWQGTNSSGTATNTGSGSTSPAITATGTYYARAVNGSCWGNEGSVAITTVTKNPSAVIVTGGGTICENATLSASGG